MNITIVGAGPAGSACAIQLLKAGFEVTLLDREKFPRSAPGETLHPGIEPLLRQLDVFDSVNTKDFIRHKGIVNVSEKETVFTPYNEEQIWKGFQLVRKEFDTILLNKAIDLGAEFLAETTPVSIELKPNGFIEKVSTNDKTLKGDFFIDATGKRAWLANKLRISFGQHSSKQIAYYGYVEVGGFNDMENPKIIWDSEGWTWLAKVKSNLISWVRLDLKGHRKKDKDWLPKELTGANAVGNRKAVDVTWKIADVVSDKNYFFIGDAAFVLDPASSHGVLKATMSGIMVAHLIRHANRTGLKELHKTYNDWLNEWFTSDKAELETLYSKYLADNSNL